MKLFLLWIFSSFYATFQSWASDCQTFWSDTFVNDDQPVREHLSVKTHHNHPEGNVNHNCHNFLVERADSFCACSRWTIAKAPTLLMWEVKVSGGWLRWKKTQKKKQRISQMKEIFWEMIQNLDANPDLRGVCAISHLETLRNEGRD